VSAAEIRLLEQRLAGLYAEQAKHEEALERFPDEHSDGSILCWEKKFQEWGQTYTFAAIKAGGLWYVTGKWQVGMLWQPFVEKFLLDAQRVWVVTEMEEIL
jgi:hypothetical protein